jgi:putative peptidoglycan lipid II flippase
VRVCWNRVKHFMLQSSLIHVHILIVVNILLAGVAFFKDILLARYFGTSYHGDALYLAFFLPDTLGNNLIAAAIGISCIPLFTKVMKEKNRFADSINTVIVIALMISISFLVLLLPSAEWLFSHFREQFHSEDQKLTYSYFLIMLPMVIFAPIAIIAASILQISNQFTKPAIMPIIFNFLLLLAILFCLVSDYPLSKGGYLYSSILLLSTIIVTFLSWYLVLKQRDISFKSVRHPIILLKENLKLIKMFLTIFTPYFVILLSQQIILLFERYLASTLETGTISGLTYAYRISQFPIWVFIAAINTVLLPTIAKLTDEVNKPLLKKELTRSLLLVIFISSFVSLTFYILGEKIIALLFLQGAFNQQSLQITSSIFQGYALSILGQSVFLFCLRYFVANGKMIIPLLTSVFGSLVHILWLFMFVPQMGAKGIGYAAALGFTTTGLVIFLFFYKDMQIGAKKVVERNDA